jgi:two-component system, cell cycle sensor histidine kinase and response regulator CckA
MEPQVFDPNQTMRNMVKMLRVLIGEDIELVTQLIDNIGRIQADPGQIEQVIMNLAVNARDAMPNGGKLTIESQACQLDEAYAAIHSEVRPGPYILIAVTDTGTGMSKETLTHIFEPFFTTKELGRGTGLGLATVYGIVKQSRGHITVYSEIDHGTVFKIYLPITQQSAKVSPTVQPRVRPTGDATILLVEDEAPLQGLVTESLKRLGYTILQATNGVEALAVAEHQVGKIDIVITDVVMPRMGGPELVGKLRDKWPDIAVIFMSGYTSATALENANIGAEAVLLNKPFSTDVLAQKVSEVQRKSSEKVKSFAAKTSG